MLNLLPYVVGVASILSSRIVLGEEPFPQVLKGGLSPLADVLEETSELLDSLKADGLSTWVKLGGHGIRYVIHSGGYKSFAGWAEAQGFGRVPSVDSFVYAPAFLKGKVAKISPPVFLDSNDEPSFFRASFDEFTCFIEVDSTLDVGDFIRQLRAGEPIEFKLFFPEDSVEKSRLQEAIAASFWEENGSFIELETEGGDLFLFGKADEAPEYSGPLTSQLDNFRCIAPGESVALGIVGTDESEKISFACYAANYLAQLYKDEIEFHPYGEESEQVTHRDQKKPRVLRIGTDSLGTIDSRYWRELYNLLRPDVVIYENIPMGGLSSALRKTLFDKRVRQVPYSLLLTDSEEVEALYLRYLDDRILVDCTEILDDANVVCEGKKQKKKRKKMAKKKKE